MWELGFGRQALTELAVLPGESRLAGAGARGGVAAAVAAVAGAGVGAVPAPAAAAAGCQGKRGHIQHHPKTLLHFHVREHRVHKMP